MPVRFMRLLVRGAAGFRSMSAVNKVYVRTSFRSKSRTIYSVVVNGKVVGKIDGVLKNKTQKIWLLELTDNPFVTILCQTLQEAKDKAVSEVCKKCH